MTRPSSCLVSPGFVGFFWLFAISTARQPATSHPQAVSTLRSKRTHDNRRSWTARPDLGLKRTLRANSAWQELRSGTHAIGTTIRTTGWVPRAVNTVPVFSLERTQTDCAFITQEPGLHGLLIRLLRCTHPKMAIITILEIVFPTTRSTERVEHECPQKLIATLIDIPGTFYAWWKMLAACVGSA